MMMDFEFKNGIKIHIPDEYAKTDRIEQWTHAKMLMSIILDPPPAAAVEREKKPYTYSEATIRKRLAWKEKKERDRARLKKK